MRFILAITIIILAILDMVSTEMLVNKIGVHVEANPLMRYVMVSHGMTITYIIRIAIAIIGSGLLVWFYHDSPRLTIGCLWLAVFLHLLIVVHHYIIWGILNV